MNLLEQLSYNHAPGPEFEAYSAELAAGHGELVRLIAYYLPQYHAIPENDAWWGKGFTEWTNVSKAIPRFSGHYQPHLPGELGFYDLRLPQVLRRQAELARQYGIRGFCFHHYWFAGKTLLEAPIRSLLDHPDIDLPFCVNWANENWSRRWDGLENEVLMRQAHSPEDDIAFIASLEPMFRDRRYIRIDGRPLLMIYRPGLLPNAGKTVQRWRSHLRAAGLGDPYIVMAQAFGDSDPRTYGMDAAVGFPPHHAGWDATRIEATLERFDPNYLGSVVAYDAMVQTALRNTPADYRVFPGVCPNWDNEARKPGRGFCFLGSTPRKYGKWLLAACRNALAAERGDERIVFINAWNEWAEGAHLEPDRHFGYAYLAETARALNALSPPVQKAAGTRAVGTPNPPPTPRAAALLAARTLARGVADIADASARWLRKL